MISVTQPYVLNLGFRDEHWRMKVYGYVDRVPVAGSHWYQEPAPEYGLIVSFRIQDMPRYGTGCEMVEFDVGRAWSDGVGMRDEYCPGCRKIQPYDQNTWNNIAAGKGTLYACELCSLRVETGRMEKIKT